MNRAQYEELCQHPREQNVVMEVMWTRHLSATKHLQEALLPRIGQFCRVYAEFSFPIVSPELGISPRFPDKNAGTGALLPARCSIKALSTHMGRYPTQPRLL